MHSRGRSGVSQLEGERQTCGDWAVVGDFGEFKGVGLFSGMGAVRKRGDAMIRYHNNFF